MNARKKNILLLTLILVTITIITINISRSVFLDNDVSIEPNSDLVYYLNVYYDGIDVAGVASNDTTMSSLSSGYILVTDKIPEGLVFEGIVDTLNGTIGAVSRNDSSVCPGEVVGGVKGISYDAENRQISFQVKNLQAGCKLTVGIRTKIPEVDDVSTEYKEKRRDFYNFATSRENQFISVSNQSHSFIGLFNTNLYKVKFEIEGDIPENISSLPSTQEHSESALVGVPQDLVAYGYTFTGWTSDDVAVTNGSFLMPRHDVTLKGSFVKENSHTVNYSINGLKPSNYTLPESKNFYANDSVRLDSLKKGNIIGNYKFMGWTSSDVSIDQDNYFLMPDADVTMVGEFKEITYDVCYQFDRNVSMNVPECQSYAEGDKVELIDMNKFVSTNSNAYAFLGYDTETEFIMPKHDVTVTASLQSIRGYFLPVLSVKSLNGEVKKYYDIGDTDNIVIQLTNTASYKIEDILIAYDTSVELEEQSEICQNSVCNPASVFTKIDNNLVRIESLNAGETFSIKAKVTLESAENNRRISLLGAIADNDYYLKEKTNFTLDYKMKSKVTFCSTAFNSKDTRTFQYHITSTNSEDESGTRYETYVRVDGNSCKDIYLANGTYKIEEIPLTGFSTRSHLKTIEVRGENLSYQFENRFKTTRFYYSYGSQNNQIMGGQ